MKKTIFPLFVLLAACVTASAQGLPRLFLDIPHIYFAAPDVEKVGNLLGAGAEAAFNVGTHWSVARIGGGATFTMDPQADEVSESFLTTPYAKLEVGLGKYRSNGNQCAKTKQSAYTAMAKGGLRYNFQAEQLDYTLGAEFGYFFIRDVFRNMEISLSGDYYTKAKVIGATFGFKFFLNLKADRSRY
jgi:hypothetical protein